jgi:VCBS repeat-containing protein
VIYTATSTDVDASATVTYSIKPLVGDAGLISINTTTGAVTLNSSANFEVKSSYTFTVVATDNGTPGLTAEKVVTVSVTDVNDAPTDIALSNNSVTENNAVSSVVGTLSTTDVDAGDSFTYTLVSGAGSTDNVSFTIVGSDLKAAASFNFEAKQSYSVRIRTNDTGGLSTENTFVITVKDVVEPVTGTPPPSAGGSSTVALHDPVTGEPTGTAVPFPGFNGTIKVVSGDFDGDGVAELIAGAGFGGGPAIAILNSQTGEVMETFFAFDPAFTGGVFVAVQDVNNDGILDIIASAGPGGGPEVRIFDGGSLNVLRSFFAYDQSFTGGVSVASVDFNNDGILDLVTGAGPGGAPHVKVFDGATNAIISQWYAYPVTFTGGVFVAIGDIGNDGTFEVVTGAGPSGAPVVAVWDPFTGAILAQFMAYAEDFTGGVRVGVNDGNGDGTADIITGAGPGGGPQVNVFNFPALDLLFSFYSGDPANTGGVFVS